MPEEAIEADLVSSIVLNVAIGNICCISVKLLLSNAQNAIKESTKVNWVCITCRKGKKPAC